MCSISREGRGLRSFTRLLPDRFLGGDIYYNDLAVREDRNSPSADWRQTQTRNGQKIFVLRKGHHLIPGWRIDHAEEWKRFLPRIAVLAAELHVPQQKISPGWSERYRRH